MNELLEAESMLSNSFLFITPFGQYTDMTAISLFFKAILIPIASTLSVDETGIGVDNNDLLTKMATPPPGRLGRSCRKPIVGPKIRLQVRFPMSFAEENDVWFGEAEVVYEFH